MSTNDLWMRLSLSHNENYYPCHQKFVHNTGILLPLGECRTTMEPQHRTISKWKPKKALPSPMSSRLTPILSQLSLSRILLTEPFLKELLLYQTQSKIIITLSVTANNPIQISL